MQVVANGVECGGQQEGGLGGYVWRVGGSDHNAGLEEFNTVCHNQRLIREKPERK